MRGSEAATEHAETHVCSSTEFVEIGAQDVEQSLVARFAAQVAIHRDCLAVRDRELALSYGELDSWANGIASETLACGGGGSTPVALFLPQGVSSVAAILGVLKSGSPYVSLDEEDPRGSELVERVGARVVLTDARHAARAHAAAGGRPVLVVDDVTPGRSPDIEPSPDDVAYVFFTSGSTGKPKGVFDSHRNVLHNVLRYTNTLQIAPGDRLSLVQSPAFSGTASTLFSGLLNGASLFPHDLATKGIAGLAQWLLDERVTVYHSVPAIFRSLVRVEEGPFDAIRIVRLEGDRATSVDVELHRRHFPRQSVLVNGLGLTETGLVRQLFVDVAADGPGVLPVGYPVPGVDVVIVDDDVTEVTPGTAGEIAVQSGHLALGYWGDDALTRAMFPSVRGRRTYLTGDLGRLREDGCLEYLGRKDGELKILGRRVEPAEVEAEILRLPGVKDAAVTTREGRRRQGQLVAYIVSESTGGPEAREIREALRERLPPYMIPAGVVFLDELPLGPAGKVDRRRLPAQLPVPVTAPAPATEFERSIARIWEHVLETRPIGPDDDFFTLGGDSLASAEIVARLEAETGVSLSMSLVAGAPTVRALAAELQKLPAALESTLVVLRTGGPEAPLVLLHGNRGHALHYAGLVRVAGADAPIWALEHRGSEARSIDDMASCHLRTLLEANPTGPYLLAGFCYGAVVAHELACRLVNAGHDVALLALLGITPLEYPRVVSADALKAWRGTHGPPPLTSKVRRHLRQTRDLPARARPRHVGRTVANLVARATSAPSEFTRTARTFQRALDQHEPRAFPGRALLVLHDDDTADYTTNPELEWASLAHEVEVVLLPGRDHAMLEEPGVRRLAELLRSSGP